MRMLTKSAATALFCITLPMSSALAEECQDKELVKAGTITGEGGSVGLILGYRWAEGTITLNDGTVHKFKAKGGKVGELGGKAMTVAGTIYNMKTLDDFAGTYSGVAAGITLFKGLGGASYTNPRCVSINVKATDSTGLQTSIPAPGVINVELVK